MFQIKVAPNHFVCVIILFSIIQDVIVGCSVTLKGSTKIEGSFPSVWEWLVWAVWEPKTCVQFSSLSPFSAAILRFIHVFSNSFIINSPFIINTLIYFAQYLMTAKYFWFFCPF